MTEKDLTAIVSEVAERANSWALYQLSAELAERGINASPVDLYLNGRLDLNRPVSSAGQLFSYLRETGRLPRG